MEWGSPIPHLLEDEELPLLHPDFVRFAPERRTVNPASAGDRRRYTISWDGPMRVKWRCRT